MDDAREREKERGSREERERRERDSKGMREKSRDIEAREKNSAVLISTRSLNPPVLSTMTQLLLRGLYRFVNYAAGIRCRIPDQVGPAGRGLQRVRCSRDKRY